jgi:hypothetical protein
MDETIREALRTTISVALAIAPKLLKRKLVDYCDPGQEKAQHQLSAAIADYVLSSFDVAERPDQLGPAPHSRFTEGRKD